MKITKVINLTPHQINILVDGNILPVPPSGKVARVEMLEKECPPIDIADQKVPVITRTPTKIKNLPEPKPNTIYLVSSMVLDNMHDHREDVFAPDTGPSAKRNEDGQIFAVTQLVCKGF